MTEMIAPQPALAPELSVVVPVRNEEDNILPLIEEIALALDGKAAFELVYVDDGSTDATASRLAEAGARCPRLRVVRHRESCGQSQAVASGVKAARGRWIATLDGDGQNDPADIPRLLEAARAAGPKTLIAGHRQKRRDTWVKRVSSRLANGIRAGLLKDATPDTGCGLKVFARDTFLDFPRFDHMHRYLPALIIRAGGKAVSVPVNHRPRRRGQSNYGFLDRLWVGVFDLIGVMWLIRRGKIPVIEPDRE